MISLFRIVVLLNRAIVSHAIRNSTHLIHLCYRESLLRIFFFLCLSLSDPMNISAAHWMYGSLFSLHYSQIMASALANCGYHSDSPWYAAFTNPSPIPKVVTSVKHINFGRKVESFAVQTIVYEPHPSLQWIGWMKTHSVMIGLVLGIAVVALCTYLHAGHLKRRRARKLKIKINNSYYESRNSSQSHGRNLYVNEESVHDGRSQDLKRHLDQKKEAQEKRLFGINLTDIHTNNLNRTDYEYSSDPHEVGEPEPRIGENIGRDLAPTSTKYRTSPPSCPQPISDDQLHGRLRNLDANGKLHSFTSLQHESKCSNESKLTKRTIVINTDSINQSHSSLTEESTVSRKTSSSTLCHTAGYRRRSVGDVMSDW